MRPQHLYARVSVRCVCMVMERYVSPKHVVSTQSAKPAGGTKPRLGINTPPPHPRVIPKMIPKVAHLGARLIVWARRRDGVKVFWFHESGFVSFYV